MSLRISVTPPFFFFSNWNTLDRVPEHLKSDQHSQMNRSLIEERIFQSFTTLRVQRHCLNAPIRWPRTLRQDFSLRPSMRKESR